MQSFVAWACLLAFISITLACSSQSQRIEELSQSPEPSSEPRPIDFLRVIDSGFVWTNDTLSYAFTLENTSPETSVEEAYVQISIFGATGEAIASDSGIIDFALPGQVVAYSGHIPLVQQPERMSLAFAAERQATVSAVRSFDRSTGAFEATSYGGRVVAAVKNPYEKDLRRLTVVAILRSADGSILNGGTAVLEALPARGESIVTVEVLGPPPEPPTSVDVYTMFSAETVFRLE